MYYVNTLVNRGIQTLTIDTDILKVMQNGGPYRPCQIREKLREKKEYNNYHDDRVFDATIARGLAKLGDKVIREQRSGHSFYSIRKEAKQKVEKELYKHDMLSEISTQDLQQTRIPKQIVKKALSDFHERLLREATKKAGFLTSIKLGKKETQFFKEVDTKEWLSRYGEVFDIGLLYPKGKMPPQIPDWAYGELLHIAVASEGFPPQVEKFKIILSCDTSRTRKPVDFDEKMFEKWLKLFKHKNIKPEILDHLRGVPLGQKESFLESADNLRELVEYREYLAEFLRKTTEYMKLIIQLTEDSLKEDPTLYQKYRSYHDTAP